MKLENAVMVTAPDLYFADNPSVLFIGVHEHLNYLIDLLRRVNKPVTVYVANEDSDLKWIQTAYLQSEITILNCEYNQLFTGFFIDKAGVFYYNNKESYKEFNLKEYEDPVDPILEWIQVCHKDEKDKSVV